MDEAGRSGSERQDEEEEVGQQDKGKDPRLDSLEESEAKSFEDIYNFLETKEYPKDYSKNDKRYLRLKAASFCIQDSTLMHIGHKGKTCRVITDIQERNRIVAHTRAGQS
jgi:hypothetical protein